MQDVLQPRGFPVARSEWDPALRAASLHGASACPACSRERLASAVVAPNRKAFPIREEDTMKVFTMHKLRKGAKMEDYIKWSREVDYPKSTAQPEVLKFEVYVIRGTVDSDDIEPAYDIMEVVEVTSIESLRRVEKRLRDFLDNEWIRDWVEESTLVNLYGEKI
jgi:hypothetical protein